MKSDATDEQPVIAAVPTRFAALAAMLLAAALLFAGALSSHADARPHSARSHSASCTHVTPRSRHLAHGCAGQAGRSHRHQRPHPHAKPSHKRPDGSRDGPRGSEEAEQGEESSTGEDHAGEGDPGSGGARARCEDNRLPQAVEEGENGLEETFVCDDGSEPTCAKGLAPAVSEDGLQLLCEAASDG